MAFYDYIITLPEEINTLWRRQKSLASIVLLINRYSLLLFVSSFVVILLPRSRDTSFAAVRRIQLKHIFTSR